MASKVRKQQANPSKPSKRSGLGSSPPPPPTKESGSQEVDADLTRALKQIFESRRGSEDSSVTLFGKKLSNPESETKNCPARQSSDKLPQAATAHLLKELHKQRLRQRGITANSYDMPDLGEIEFVHTEKRAEVSTMPLLNCLQEKRGLSTSQEDCDGREPKRQRIDDSVDLSLSIRSNSCSFGAPNANDAAAAAANGVKHMEIGTTINRSEQTTANKNVEQLTLFYNGSVYVYDDVPSDKAKAIMILANSISSKTSCYKNGAALPLPVPTKAEVKSNAASTDKETAPQQARKQSIQRFLGLRRDRLNPSKAATSSDKELSLEVPSKNSKEGLENKMHVHGEVEQTTTATTTTAMANSAKRIGV